MFWVVVAFLYFVLAAVAPSILGLFVNRARPDFGTLSFFRKTAYGWPFQMEADQALQGGR